MAIGEWWNSSEWQMASSEWRTENGFDHLLEVGDYYLGCELRVVSGGLGFFERATRNSLLACFSKFCFAATDFSR